jgi:hypothetical protein
MIAPAFKKLYPKLANAKTAMHMGLAEAVDQFTNSWIPHPAGLRQLGRNDDMFCRVV